MDTNENYQLTAGTALTLDVTLRDQDGNAITNYDGTEALTATVWPGADMPASFTAVTTWITPASGTIRIAVAAADTSSLTTGRYQLLARVQPAGRDPVDAYGCSIDILQGPGAGTKPKMYVDYGHLLRYGRGWIRQLQTDDDEAGFAQQIGRATSWFDDVLHAHWRVASMVLVVGGQAFGPRRSGARSTWLQDQLDAVPPKIMFNDQIRECVAKKALAYICEGQIGVGEQSREYGRLARMYHGQSDYLATCLTVSLDTDGNGFPDVTISCSCTDPMFA
jgi:hypothetical protein